MKFSKAREADVPPMPVTKRLSVPIASSAPARSSVIGKRAAMTLLTLWRDEAVLVIYPEGMIVPIESTVPRAFGYSAAE